MEGLDHSRKASNGFRTLGLITIAAVYALIAVGGIVRATGSGMGCPDWPKCFGRWVPPTAESQLPADYQETYAEHGYGQDRFNVWKTWTEYVNRLIGVVIGFLIFGVMLASFRFWRSDRPVVWWSVAAFLLVGFQGWLGSVVVSTNLAPWMVTVHMLVALVIVGILIYAVARGVVSSESTLSADTAGSGGRKLEWLFGFCLLLSMIQIGMGTQVREQVDETARAVVERADWIGELGSLVLVHRTFSLVLVIANAVLVYWLWRRQRDSVSRAVGGERGPNGVGSGGSGGVGNRGSGGSPVGPTILRLGFVLLAVLGAEAVAGTLLFYLAIPPVLQPVHLVLAAILAGVQFAMWVLYRSRVAV